MSEKEGCTRTDCSQQASKAGTMSSATEEIFAACSPFHLVLWRETFYICCPFEFAEWQSLCSVISKERRRGCSSLVAYKTNLVQIADSFGGSVQSWCYAAALLGTRGQGQPWLLPEYSSAEYASAGYPLCFCGLLRFFSKMGHRHIVHVTLSPCCSLQRETPEFIPPDLNPVDYSRWGMLQERVYHSRIHDVNELKERLLSEWRLLIHTVMRLRSGVVVCMHVFAWMVDILNINSEPLTFCCVLFVSSILVSVNVWSI